MTEPTPKPIYGYAIVYTSRLNRAHFTGGYFRTRKEARDWWLDMWVDKARAAREWRRDTRDGSIRIAKVEMRELI